MIITYAQAEALCAKARDKVRGKLLCNNTYLMARSDHYAVVLHNTAVVKIYPKDVYELNSGGWRTPTTKDRINQFSPVQISTVRGVWHFNGYVFEDGMRVDASGKPIGKTISLDDIKSKKDALNKEVSNYVKRFIEHMKKEGLKDPDSGDCWMCGFFAKSGDVSHLISHMEEDYFVSSLLYQALVERVAGKDKEPDDKAKQTIALRWYLMKKDPRDASLLLRGYFTRRKSELLKEFDLTTFRKNRKERGKKG